MSVEKVPLLGFSLHAGKRKPILFHPVVLSIGVALLLSAATICYVYLLGHTKSTLGASVKNVQGIDQIYQQTLGVIQKNVSNNTIRSVSVYFRDLTGGRTFIVNGNEKFFPASLMKVPTMITYYKFRETNPHVALQKFLYNGPQQNDVQVFPPTHPMVSHAYYTIDELVQQMIVYSDNEASLMVNQYLGPKRLLDTYTHFGVDTHAFSLKDDQIAVNSSDYDYMTVGTYAQFFSSLYTGSYLSKASSQKALQLLQKSRFTQGLIAGVPSSLVVSHKFGEFEYGQDVQLHDCGIIYYPSRPYVLCIMTKGYDMQMLTKVIQEITKAVNTAYGKS